MTQRVLNKTSRSYSIRKHRDVFRYRVTVPNELFEQAGIEQGTTVGVKALCEDGYLVLCYTTDLQDTLLTVSASKHSSGELTIPSAFGAAARLNEYELTWELRESDTGAYELYGITTLKLPEYTNKNSVFLQIRDLHHVEQDVETDDNEWSQEHFQLYLDVHAVEQIGWPNGAEISVELCQVNDEVSVQFNPDTSKANEKSLKTVRRTGEAQKDRLVYVPNDIVRTIGLIDETLALRKTDDQILVIEQV